MSLRPKTGTRADVAALRGALATAAKQARQYVDIGTMSTKTENRPALRPDKLQDVVDVPRDGHCLYSCLAELYNQSPWLGNSLGMLDAYSVRTLIAGKFVEMSDVFKREHGAAVIEFVKNRPGRKGALSYTDSVPIYAESIRGRTWGGNAELDVAASLFGVRIHLFSVLTEVGGIKDAQLETTFSPELGDVPFAQWQVIYIRNHFLYVRPSQPRHLQLPPPSTPSEDERKRPLLAEAANNRIQAAKKKAARSASSGNELTKQLTQEREARACAVEPATLTDEQREQIVESDRRLAERIAVQELQMDRDFEQACRLSQQY